MTEKERQHTANFTDFTRDICVTSAIPGYCPSVADRDSRRLNILDLNLLDDPLHTLRQNNAGCGSTRKCIGGKVRRGGKVP
jgi:hypothetical protein